MPLIPSRPLGDIQLATVQAADTSAALRPASQTLPPTAASAQVAADTLTSGSLVQGSAQLTLALNADEASELWKQAGKGSKLGLTPKADARMPQLGALMDYVKNATDLSAGQKEKFTTFLREFAGRGPDQAKALRQLEDLLKHSGITREQLMLIADGKFTAADLNTVLRGSSGPSLLGQAPTTGGAARTAALIKEPELKNAVSATPPEQGLN